ncbi:MAG TPA: hypothetical protein VFP92_11025 [Rhodanobacteraceae bacterium]|nr:hypothetical protein [Rhodanobacteraceae bacterium]
MKLDRHFQFRGTRDYLHSASVFDDLLRVRGKNSTNIDLKFHRRTDRQVSYVDELADGEPVAEWSDSGGRLFVIEREEHISECAPYDEDGLAARFEIEGRIAKIPSAIGPFTRMEAVIAGFKRLLQSVYPDAKRKYVFVRVRLDHCPDAALEIQYARDIGAFYQGNISKDGKLIGQIFFGVW